MIHTTTAISIEVASQNVIKAIKQRLPIPRNKRDDVRVATLDFVHVNDVYSAAKKSKLGIGSIVYIHTNNDGVFCEVMEVFRRPNNVLINGKAIALVVTPVEGYTTKNTLLLDLKSL